MTKTFGIIALLLAASCAVEEPTPESVSLVFYHLETGKKCIPDGATYKPLYGRGDNQDDPHSGMEDCHGDGDSGHGNDWWRCQPGCDASGCCGEEPGDDDDDCDYALDQDGNCPPAPDDDQDGPDLPDDDDDGTISAPDDDEDGPILLPDDDDDGPTSLSL